MSGIQSVKMNADSERNSWFQFLENLLNNESGMPPPNESSLSRAFGGQLHPEIWLLKYECTLCMKSILELRMGKCTHNYCSSCVPRFNCSIACRLSMLHMISKGDNTRSQEKIIADFKASGSFVDNSPRSYKRKELDEDDDDEMSE